MVNKRFEALSGTGTVIRLDHVFVAFSVDVIGRLCCEDHTDMLKDAEFTPQWLDMQTSQEPLLTGYRYNVLHGIVLAIPLFMGFPFAIKYVAGCGYRKSEDNPWAADVVKGRQCDTGALFHVGGFEHPKICNVQRGTYFYTQL